MQTIPAVQAQTRFGELLDQAQREIVEITRYGRTIAYVVSAHEMKEMQGNVQRRKAAASALRAYGASVLANRATGVVNPSEEDMTPLANELRS
ncbi:MAG: type II toxin-antitoxin system prevent-host-death family antitoxin [Betaproteobacteria bacterium]|nr:MAG: type II toxin-antitoxin system prevent-host-death family antitoxin [Betaproteobacteria bacterium]